MWATLPRTKGKNWNVIEPLVLGKLSLKKKIILMLYKIYIYTGKSLSEALIFASTNPQYDDRLFNT